MSKTYSTNNLNELIVSALKQSEYWTNKTRESGNTIQGLTCPACNGKGAGWCYSNSPMSINCNRMNECGARTKTIPLFKIHQNIEKEFKSTKAHPNRPAHAFLESRGLKHTLKGLDYSYWKDVRKTGSGAVMFPIGKGSNGKAVFNGRLINPRSQDGKTHNSGSTNGKFWQHPTFEYDPYKPTYITEGIIDALSLLEIGHQAIAVLASGQDPAKVNLFQFRKLICCFDNDQAGARATKKWKQHYPDAETIMPDHGQDFNDILCSAPLEQVKKRFSENLPRYKVNADLALADSARDYAIIYRDYFEKVPGLFIFDTCTYFSSLRKKGDDSFLQVERVGRFILNVISYFKDTTNPNHPEYRYNLQITPKGGRPVTVVATGRALATPGALKEFFLTHTKVSFEAAASATTALSTMITTAKQAPEVLQLPLTGYNLQTEWYVYKHFAIDTTGRICLPDSGGLYKINHRDKVTPPPDAGDKAVKPAKKGKAVQDIHSLITTAWNNNGATAIAWMTAGWFVNQIKDQIGFFPFLSFFGDPGSAKSALTVTLNAMQGIDSEGIGINSLNTKKGISRSISRRSGNFIALLENNERNDRTFDFAMMLTAFNKGALQVQAAFSNDNRTVEAPFQGSLLFVQNNEPFTAKAEKQRVISLQFKTDALSDITRKAYEDLLNIPLPELARVFVLTLQKRKVFEKEWPEEYLKAITDLKGIENRRILQNHSLVLAFHRLFCKVHNIDYDLTEFLTKTAEIKCQTSAIKEFTLSDHFFDTIDQLDDEKTATCLHLDEKKRLIYINLPGMEQLIRNKGLQFSVSSQLTQSLIQHPAFVENSKRFRFPRDPELDIRGQPKQRRSWVFSADKFE